MLSRPACLVLGLGIGSLVFPLLYDVAAHLLAGQPLIYPKET